MSGFASTHDRQHNLASTLDHIGATGSQYVPFVLDANGLPSAHPTLMITPIGGIARKVLNKTGGATVIGEGCVPSSTTDNAVEKMPINALNCIGVWYEGGVADGQEAWMVFYGTVDFLADATGSTRADVVFPSSATAGRFKTDVIPTPPNADQHFRECGHALEGKGANTLFRGFIHFN